ncbi:unnamed protein product [Polarella glacialis]|uniref:Uncharacterized protein n=1 Tax=Polarella glacialis TaxID=89957 RepID=A0A813HBV8_POLGL|nr:unnamed protein product [Polarella glacialis]
MGSLSAPVPSCGNEPAWPSIAEPRFAYMAYYLIELGMVGAQLPEVFFGEASSVCLALAAVRVSLDAFGEPPPAGLAAAVEGWVRRLLHGDEESRRLERLEATLRGLARNARTEELSMIASKWARRAQLGQLGGALPVPPEPVAAPSCSSSSSSNCSSNSSSNSSNNDSNDNNSNDNSSNNNNNSSSSSSSSSAPATKQHCNDEAPVTPQKTGGLRLQPLDETPCLEDSSPPSQSRGLSEGGSWNGCWCALEWKGDFDIQDEHLHLGSGPEGLKLKLQLDNGITKIQWPGGLIQKCIAIDRFSTLVRWLFGDELQCLWHKLPDASGKGMLSTGAEFNWDGRWRAYMRLPSYDVHNGELTTSSQDGTCLHKFLDEPVKCVADWLDGTAGQTTGTAQAKHIVWKQEPEKGDGERKKRRVQ